MDEIIEMPAAEGSPPGQKAVHDLKALREASGLSLPDIFAETRVGLVNLEAVESGDFGRLPPPVYARNFIRKYACAVGIDEKPILARYEKYLENNQPAGGETDIQKPWPEKGRRSRFLFASLAAVVMAGVLVSALFLYDQAGKTASPTPVMDPPSPAQMIPDPAPAAPDPASPAPAAGEAVPVATPAAANQPSAEQGRYRLVVEAQALTWIAITADGDSASEALLKPGDKIERTASDHFQLVIGNAGGVHLTFQGKPLGSPGKSGQVIRLRLPESGPDRRAP